MDKSETLKNFIGGILGIAQELHDYINMDKIDNQYDRIILIGAHGTGKSTLAQGLSELLGFPVVESVAREFKKDMQYLEEAKVFDPRISKLQLKDAQQNVICSMSYWDFMRWVKAEVPCIMTRCPLDTLAYAMTDKEVTNSTYKNNLIILKENPEFMEAIHKSMFVYLPIEFGLEDDGVRPTDKEYQKHVDRAMRQLIYRFEIAPLVVTGTVEERIEQVLVKAVGKDATEFLMRKFNNE